MDYPNIVYAGEMTFVNSTKNIYCFLSMRFKNNFPLKKTHKVQQRLLASIKIVFFLFRELSNFFSIKFRLYLGGRISIHTQYLHLHCLSKPLSGLFIAERYG